MLALVSNRGEYIFLQTALHCIDGSSANIVGIEKDQQTSKQAGRIRGGLDWTGWSIAANGQGVREVRE